MTIIPGIGASAARATAELPAVVLDCAIVPPDGSACEPEHPAMALTVKNPSAKV
jgi:hypothetical protein